MGNRLDVCQLGFGLLISLLSPYQLQGDIYHCFSCTPLGTFWSGHGVIIKTDSQVAPAILNKGSTCCPLIIDWIRSLFWLKEYCNFSLLVKHIPGTTNTLPGSNDFESYMSPLSLALLRSKGSAATWPWSHQFPAPSVCTFYHVHLSEWKAFIPILLCILRLPASPSTSINP